jgi:hypothetical protein
MYHVIARDLWQCGAPLCQCDLRHLEPFKKITVPRVRPDGLVAGAAHADEFDMRATWPVRGEFSHTEDCCQFMPVWGQPCADTGGLKRKKSTITQHVRIFVSKLLQVTENSEADICRHLWKPKEKRNLDVG